ncbi:HD domain-containing protein [Alteribacter natronophilus]|uniref:HD domain-containing protein n=1 Tax=Alteribacter natronophilus TaxID=2583810 RepID=UPI00110F2FD4|nr:HD domain-containing protein [Alteribacter natronophilus]TMW72924.1 HD domain-containing protein [Alteribacter natronophilus]
MERVTLTQILNHEVTQKFVKRSGLAHAVAVSEYAFRLAKVHDVNPDLAVKAAFLHDIGHYTWYRNGKWDYSLYKENDIHAIKGAERAHKLLIRLGEHPVNAKKIALAVLLHTDSYLPEGDLKLDPLQHVVALADKKDEEPGGKHHYKTISDEEAEERLGKLDRLVEQALKSENQKSALAQSASVS